jgi:hypothetical protein
VRIVDQAFQQRDRPRRGGDQLARPWPQPQAELQHVESGLRVAPLRQLVAPGGVELRPAQAFRIVGGEGLRHRAVRPFEAAARRRPQRTHRTRRDAHQPGRSLDHHFAHVVFAFADERDVAERRVGVRRKSLRQRPHPFGAESCFAGAAPAEREPGGPWPAIVGVNRRLLVRVRENGEVAVKPAPAAAVRNLRLHFLRQSGLRRKH